MRNILHSKFLYPALIIFLVVFIGVTNYRPNTYLVGWDSLQTELSPFLAVKRALFSSWQEYQNFGLVSGMAHAADIVRAVLVWIFSFFLPKWLIRYVFHLLMLAIGGMGIYLLLDYLGFRDKKRILSFFGAMFYMLNLGTVQIFSLPFEPFSVFFAFLPFGILYFLKFIYESELKSRHFIKFLFLHFIFSPFAYLQTLFIVYMLCLIFMTVGLLLENKSFRVQIVRRSLIAGLLVITANLFWIIPQMYFIKTSLNVVGQSKINQLATTIVSKQNMEKGTISNFAKLEGFYYDLSNTEGKSIFEVWHNHFGNFFTNIISHVPFLLVILGIFTRRKNHYGFISIFVLVSLMLLSNTAVLSYFNSIIFSHEFINQIFRSPFTKFIIPLSLVFTYLFICGVNFLLELYVRLSGEENIIEVVVTHFIVVLIILVYSLPVFTGNFFSPIMKVNIPNAYFDVMSYFDHEDKNKRIALLPEYTFWGWYSTKWGYDGSGFLWYGIKQPIVSRTFDVWSQPGESYFWEIKYAIETADPDLFDKVVQKYRIDYFILDKTLRPVSSVEDGLQYDQIDKILAQSLEYEKVFTTDELDIIKINHANKADNFIQLITGLKNIGPLAVITNLDEAYLQHGAYKSRYDDKNYDYYYPFLDLSTQTNLKSKKWEIFEDEDYIVLSADLGSIDQEYYEIEYDLDKLDDAEVFLGKDIKKYKYDVSQEIVDDKLVLKIRKMVVQRFDPTYVNVDNCRSLGTFSVTKRGGNLIISSKNRGMACFGYESPLLAHWNSYLINVESENTKGNGLFFYIFGNRLRKQSKIETDLIDGEQYFIINPGYFLDDGYFFSFQNPSYQFMESENILKNLEISLFPYDFVKSIKFVKKDLRDNQPNSILENESQTLTFFDAKKINYYTYVINNPKKDGVNIILYQAYDSGWSAYEVSSLSLINKVLPFLYGNKINDHYIVNNWANGWPLSEHSTDYIILFYWPQMLEFIGVAVLLFAVPAAYLLSKKMTL